MMSGHAHAESARRVGDCVTALLRDQPFFGSLALRLPTFRNQRTDNIIAVKCSITSYTYTIFLPNWRGPVTPALVP